MKILYVSTISSTVIAFMIPHIQMLVAQGHQVDLAFNITKEVPENLASLVTNIYNLPFQRSPASPKNLKAFKQLKTILKTNQYDLVHTHTPVASALTRLACIGHKAKVFYTAHGFHFFKGASLVNWLVYFPVEWVLSFFTDVLITINEEDYAFAKRRLHTKSIEYVPGVGIDVAKFQNLQVDKNKKRKELDIPANAFVLLSVGELNQNKNHQQVIKALAECQKEDIYYLIAGKGNLEAKLKFLAQELGVAQQVFFLGYRRDIPELMQVIDVFIHPSHREGLPVSLMEAMASALPCIASNIRGNADLLKDDSKPFLCHPTDHQAFATAITKLYNDKSLATHLAQQNQIAVQPFTQSNVNKELKRIYNLN